MLRPGVRADADFLQIGVGLGLTQGFAVGTAMGLGLVVLLIWRDAAVKRGESKSIDRERSRTGGIWKLVLGAMAAICLSIVCGSVAFVAGGVIGQEQLYRAYTDRKLDKIAAILRSGDFPDVESGYSSAAQVYLTGHVKDEPQRQTLHKELLLAFGSEEADTIIRSVNVRQ
jgi:hypothetical protein